MRKNFMGLDGFVWWMGVVENRLDPLKLGRVQVRMFGLHTSDKGLIPSEDLPWAHPMMPVNILMVSTPKEGDYVVGFFLDGDAMQYPVVMGILPGTPTQTPSISLGFSDQRTNFDAYPAEGINALSDRYPNRLNESTLNRVSRNETLENTVIQTMKDNQVGPEPVTAYAAKYPFNNAMESESGHVFELDDTPGVERVNLAHRSGTYIEMRPDGSKTEKVIVDGVEVIIGNNSIFVGGDCTLQVGGNLKILVQGKVSMESGESIELSAPGGVSILQGSVYVEGSASIGNGATGTFTTPNGDVVDVISGIVVNID